MGRWAELAHLGSRQGLRLPCSHRLLGARCSQVPILGPRHHEWRGPIHVANVGVHGPAKMGLQPILGQAHAHVGQHGQV